MKKVTVDDLAQKLGVSKSTISRALNGSARISAKTREAVQKLAYEMGYYENAFSAAELANPLPANIGVCLADLNNPFSIQIIKGVQDTCARYGYNLILADSDMDEAREVRNIQNFLQMGVKGMVIHAAFADTHEKVAQMALDIPQVYLSRKYRIGEANFVCVDTREALYTATEYLIQLGHKRIAFVGASRATKKPWPNTSCPCGTATSRCAPPPA